MGLTAKAGLLFAMVALIIGGQLLERDFARRRQELKAQKAAASVHAELLSPLPDASLPNRPAGPPVAGDRRGGGADAAPAAGDPVYIVQPGDTLARIARKLCGHEGAWKLIYERNRAAIPNPAQLQVGTALRIPRGERVERR